MAIIRHKSIVTTVIFGGASLLGSPEINAQAFGLEYTGELQTDFKGGYDFLNLLSVTANAHLSHNLSFQAKTISTAKTGHSPLVEDLLTYSNIEAQNIPLTFGRLGFGLNIRGAEWFAGINNVNEDYFISPQTSFFTNSACGISPTISCNFDIANYPVASWCIHYHQQLGDWSVQSSLYTGQAYSRLLGHDNLFSLKLKRDGIFSISSFDYKRDDFYCILGIAMHYGHLAGDADAGIDGPAQAPVAETKKRFSAAPWILSEVTLPHNLGLHLHGSYASVSEGCNGYAGIGMVYYGRRVQPGIAFNYAHFTFASEYSFELTCHIPILPDKVSIQPALHLVGPDMSAPKCVGMLRVLVAI